MVLKKEVLFVLLLVLVLGFGSAGFFSDSWDKVKGAITGNAVYGCMDSDGGIEPYVSGYTYGSSAGGMIDRCTNSYYLKEAYCTSSGGISSKEIKCEYGCNAGKCNTQEECESPEGCELNKNYCLDEDFGNFFEKGDAYTVKVGWYENGSDFVSFKGTDSCMDSRWIEEYICRDSGVVARSYVVCPDGCSDGACIKGEKYEEALRSNCQDSFEGPSGMERLFHKGTVSYGGEIYEDYCVSNGIVKEYSCDMFGLLKGVNTGCVNGCEDGVCLRFSNTTNDETNTNDPPQNSNSGEENCQNEGLCTYSGQKYCEDGYSVVCTNLDLDSCLETSKVYCENGCSEEGDCLEAPSSSTNGETKSLEFICEDSDSGKDYRVRGNVTFGGSNLEDYCVPNQNILIEFFCEGGYPKAQEHECSDSCIEGRCAEGFGSSSSGENSSSEENNLKRGEVNYSGLMSGEDCLGCISSGICYPENYVLEGEYCNSRTNSFTRQKEAGGICRGNYHCLSGFCKNGRCFSGLIIQDSKNCESGCSKEGICYGVGSVADGKFCSEDLEFVEQFEIGELCSENFECDSNLCSEGRCNSVGFWKKFVGFFRKLI